MALIRREIHPRRTDYFLLGGQSRVSRRPSPEFSRCGTGRHILVQGAREDLYEPRIERHVWIQDQDVVRIFGGDETVMRRAEPDVPGGEARGMEHASVFRDDFQCGVCGRIVPKT